MKSPTTAAKVNPFAPFDPVHVLFAFSCVADSDKPTWPMKAKAKAAKKTTTKKGDRR